ncbi:MAG: insulinase family protein, partial [Lentisphaerota bacterium]
RARPPLVLPSEPAQMAPRFARQTGAYEVSRLVCAYHTTALSHPDTPALDVLAVLAGSGRSSHLVQEIQEKQQLALDISAWSSTPKEPGLFGISATYDAAHEQALITAMDQEIELWKKGAFSAEELDKARRMVLVGALSELQSMEGQASSYVSGEFYTANPRFSEQYLEQVQQVTTDRIADVARRYLTPENRTMVILSPTTGVAAAASVAPESEAINLKRIVLSNGVPLIVRLDHRLPFVHICAVLRGGLLSETESNNGITQIMSELLTRGAGQRTAAEIARQVESLGGSLSAFSGRNSFGLQASCLSQDTETFMQLVSDCLLQPVFPEDEFEKRKVEQLAAIRQQREQPFFIADEALRQALFANHPYRWTVEGSEPTVQSLKRDEVREYFARHLSTSNLVLSIFGDITLDQARLLADRCLSGLPDRPFASEAQILPNPRLPVRIKKREPRQQAVLLIGYPGVDLKDPRVDMLNLAANALSGLSSELNTEVREKRGLVYSIGGFQRTGIGAGIFTLYAAACEDTVAEVENIMNVELSRITRKGLTDDEFKRAKAQIEADHDKALQNNGGLAQSCALDELFGLGYRYSFDVKDRMNKITPEAVKKAAASIFETDRRAVSLVLPEPAGEKQEKNHETK